VELNQQQLLTLSLAFYCPAPLTPIKLHDIPDYPVTYSASSSKYGPGIFVKTDDAVPIGGGA
jgi:hypothetical protein